MTETVRIQVPLDTHSLFVPSTKVTILRHVLVGSYVEAYSLARARDISMDTCEVSRSGDCAGLKNRRKWIDTTTSHNIGGSSKGRTTVSESVNLGSSPKLPTQLIS